MSNSSSICWKCVNREVCKMFYMSPKSKVTECGKFLMSKDNKAIMQALYEHFGMSYVKGFGEGME